MTSFYLRSTRKHQESSGRRTYSQQHHSLSNVCSCLQFALYKQLFVLSTDKFCYRVYNCFSIPFRNIPKRNERGASMCYRPPPSHQNGRGVFLPSSSSSSSSSLSSLPSPLYHFMYSRSVTSSSMTSISQAASALNLTSPPSRLYSL